MEPISPRGRALLDTYKRESAPSELALARARQGIAARLPSVREPVQEAASPSPKLVPARPRGSWAWAYGSVLVMIGGLSLHPTAPHALRPSLAPQEVVVLQTPVPASSSSPEAGRPVASPIATEPQRAQQRPTSGSAPPPRTALRSTRKRPTSAVEVGRVTSAIALVAHDDDVQARADSPDRAITPRTPELPAPTASEARVVSSPARNAASERSAQGEDATRATERVNTKPFPADQATLDAEVMQMAAVYAALRAGNPQRALSAIDEHARRFPGAKLRELAGVARVLALCDLGRTEAARRAADDFLNGFAGSIHTARVRSICRAPP